MLAIVILFTFQTVYAGVLPSDWANKIDSTLQLPKREWDAVSQTKSYFYESFAPIAKSVVAVLAIIAIAVIIFQVWISEWEAKEIKNFKSSIWYLVLWSALIWLSTVLWQAFDPSQHAQNIWDMKLINDTVDLIYSFVQNIAGWVAIFILILTWFNIVTDTSGWSKKSAENMKSLYNTILWIIAIFTAKNFILGVIYDNWMQAPDWNTTVTNASNEVMSVMRFGLQYLWMWAFIVFLLAWVYYVIWWEKWDADAKKIMKTAFVWLVVIMMSYSILTALIPYWW